MSSNNRVTLLFAGDFCSRPSATNIKADTELKSIIANSDLAVVNFETPLLPTGTAPIDRKFFQHHDSVGFLKGLGFSLFNICNNHILDYGSRGAIETINQLGKNVVMGISAEKVVPYYKIINGVKIAFLPLCYDSYATDFRNEYCVNSISSSSIQDVIAEAKQNSDYVIVMPHDGVEYIKIPTPHIRRLYKQFVDWGASAVVATHPHCIQGMERYKNAPIIYSTGNLFFNSKNTLDFVSDLPGWYNGMMVKLSFGNDGIEPEWIFTKNIRNRELVVDHSDDRVEYFYGLCDILSDDKKYEDVLNEVMERLFYNKYLPAINCLYRIQLRSKRGWIFLLKQIYAAIKHRGNQTEYLKFILRSNTERDLLVESINKFL